MKLALKIGIAALALCAAAPASAALTLIPGFPCDKTTTDPDAIACAGSYAGNLNNAADIADLNAALDALMGGSYDPNLVYTQSVDDTKALFDEDGGVLSFTDTLFGVNILSIHFGGAGFYPPGTGGGTILYLFDFGTEGADSITLNQDGWSNTILIGGGSVPEPATWAMMLMGFGAAGYAIRRRRKALLTQVA